MAAGPPGHARSPSSTASTSTSPTRCKRVEAMIAPPGGAAAMYYTGPSEDFSRPGRTWYPTLGKTRFPLWGEVSICYHEGVPGHHLQIATGALPRRRAQPLPAHAGGLVGPRRGLGAVRRAADGRARLPRRPRTTSSGCCAAQAMRAMRVVVDIGLHLELPIPNDERYHPGETWTPELALPFAIERSKMPEDFMASEVDRYLGWPGQAISYKVGERVWLAAREDGEAAGRRRLRPQGVPRPRVRTRPDGPRAAPARADRRVRPTWTSRARSRPAPTSSTTPCWPSRSATSALGSTTPPPSTRTSGSRSPASPSTRTVSGSALPSSSRACGTCSHRRPRSRRWRAWRPVVPSPPSAPGSPVAWRSASGRCRGRK